MNVSTTIKVEFDEESDASAVSFEPHDDNRILLQQGSDMILLPKKDVAEFCRVLAEWAAKE